MKRLLMTVVLCFAMSGSAFAGDVPSVDVRSPEPDKAVSTTPTAPPTDESSGGLVYEFPGDGLDVIQILLGLLVL